MSLKENIQQLADTTDLTNKEIALRLGCSRRSVRRHVGRWADRIRKRSVRLPDIKTPDIAKILLFDIETAPIECYTWSLFPKYISHDFVIKDWSILSWAAKWLFSDTILSQVVTREEAVNRTEGSVLKGIWDLLNEADIVIAHNGAKFDVKKLNTKFVMAGMQPPMPYRVIDTLSVVRRAFAFSSNKLDYLVKQLNNESKAETGGFKLWKDCMAGDMEALAKMVDYNKKDVAIMEELYVTVRPWIKGHPNVGLYIDTDKTVCTNCGNENLNWGGYYYTPAGKYASFRCTGCGAIGRSRHMAIDKEDRERLVLSVAR
jgi:hypothetical protein